ncbi:MAG: LamG domain-containing protein [Gammaproteobacteria bacterium]|nr:LamG domain-containing protein [Gammaproteobacteria bacterium]
MMAVNYKEYFIRASRTLSIVWIAVLLVCFSSSLQAAATLLSHYQFDVCSDSDLGNDSLGSYHGTLSGAVGLNKNPPAGKQTCSAATFNGGTISVTGLPVSTTSGDKTSISFWMYWDGTNSVMPMGWGRYDLWFYGGNFGFNSASGDLYGMSSAGLVNGWHHVVAVFTNGNVQANSLYIDGVSQTLSQLRNTPNNSSAVVQSNLRISGWSLSSGYRFSGHLDEVKVYNGEMTQSQVNADLNYSELSCVVCPPDPPPVLIGHYQFDVCNSSDLGTDTLGLNDGVVSGGVTLGKTPPSGKPDTCTDGIFGGGAIDINGLPVSLNTGDKTSVSFWMYWDGVNGVMPLGWNRYDLWFYGGNFGFNTAGGDLYGISSTGLANGWHHVAAVFTNGDVRSNELYIDGVSQTLTHLRGVIRNNNAVVNSHLRVGGWWASNGYRFAGRIDELKVYSGKITQTEVDVDRTYNKAICTNCPPPPPAELKSYFSFNENWSSSVLDIIGGHNGSVSGNITRVLAGAGGLKGDTCYAASFNGGAIDINGLPLSTSSGEKSSVSFWMYWNGNNSVMPLGWNKHDLWFYGGNFGFNTAGGDIYGISSSGLANGWHHISVVFTNGSVVDNNLYVDGVKQSLSLKRGSIRNTNAYVASHLRLGGWWYNNSYRFRGSLDDVKVYEGEISETQVLADMQANGCLIAEWRMDEPSWDGSVGEVKDNTSNAYHGTSFNGVNTISKSLSGGGICQAGQFGDDGYVEISTVPHMTDSFSITGWFYTNDNNEKGQRLFVDDENNNSGGYAISVGDPGRGRMRFYHRSFNPVSLDTSPNLIASNQWYFVAATLTVLPSNKATKELYLYDASGTLLEYKSKQVNNAMQAATGSASIGGEVNGSGEEGKRFDGYVDEIKVFSKALSATEVASIVDNERVGKNWDGTTRTCSASCALEGFSIVQEDHSLACPQARASINITAQCAGNVTKEDYAGTVNLTSNKTGSEFYSSGTGGSSINSTQFQTSDKGVKTVYLYHPQEETVQVSGTDTFPNPDIVGIGNATDFRAFGFSTSTIGVQTSCVDSTSYQLTALGKLSGNAGCDVIENFSGNKNIKIWFDYNSPSNNSSGTLVKINGNSIPTSESTTTVLNFTNGRASYQLNYADAGQLGLHFKYDDAPYDGSTHQAMFSDSNLFVVKPEKLFVYASDSVGVADSSSACTGTSCTKFKQAEEDFYFTVRAACSDDSITPNFNYTGSIVLNSILQLPAAGFGNIGTVSFNDISAGQKTVVQNFSDVGIIKINASLGGNYLGETISLSGSSDNIGRFYPAYFNVVANTPIVQEACTSGSSPFTYMGQAFDFSVTPTLTITAKSLNNNTVYNYSNKDGDNFWKLAAVSKSGRSYSDTSGYASLNNANAASGDELLPVGIADFLDPVSSVDSRENAFDGSAVLTITGDYLKYDRALVAPFDSQFDLTISMASLTDTDNVCYKVNAAGSCQNFSFNINSLAEQRMGRLKIKNAYGSELAPLTVPLFGEYYTGSGFVVNTEDTCSSVTTSHLSLTHTTLNGTYSTASNIANIPFVAGVAGLSFSAPGVNNTGYTDIQLINIDNWLLYDWDNGGAYNDAPSGRASFGQYNRSKRLIFTREVY